MDYGLTARRLSSEGNSMKNLIRVAIFSILLLALAWPGAAMAKGILPDRVVPGGNFTLRSGETLSGSLFVLGGNALLEEGSTVTGDVVLLGGNLQSSGLIRGSIIGLGGLVRLESTAVLGGDAVMIGSELSQAPGARVEGSVFDQSTVTFNGNFPDGLDIPRFDVGFTPLINVMGFLFKLFLWAALAVLVALFLPENTRRVSHTIVSAPLVSGGLGLLTVAVLLPLLVILTITILLIPLSLAVAAVSVVVWIWGLVALGLEVGKRLAEVVKQEWAPAVSAAAGTFVLILVINGARELIPCVGWIVPALAGMLGLGAVLLTRFGTQIYPVPYVPPAPLAPVIVPEEAPPTPSQSGVDPLQMVEEVDVEVEEPAPPAEVEESPASDEAEGGDADKGYVDQG